MEKLALDAEVQSITDLPSGICDEHFYAALAKESPHSAEELKRRHREPGGRTLADIWKNLYLQQGTA